MNRKYTINEKPANCGKTVNQTECHTRCADWHQHYHRTLPRHIGKLHTKYASLAVSVTVTHRQALHPTHTRVLHDAATIRCQRSKRLFSNFGWPSPTVETCQSGDMNHVQVHEMIPLQEETASSNDELQRRKITHFQQGVQPDEKTLRPQGNEYVSPNTVTSRYSEHSTHRLQDFTLQRWMTTWFCSFQL